MSNTIKRRVASALTVSGVIGAVVAVVAVADRLMTAYGKKWM